MSKHRVAVLEGNNYCTWKLQCQMALMRDGLWGMVDGTEVEPEEVGPRTKFLEKRNRALGCGHTAPLSTRNTNQPKGGVATLRKPVPEEILAKRPGTTKEASSNQARSRRIDEPAY